MVSIIILDVIIIILSLGIEFDKLVRYTTKKKKIHSNALTRGRFDFNVNGEKVEKKKKLSSSENIVRAKISRDSARNYCTVFTTKFDFFVNTFYFVLERARYRQ